MRRTIESPRGFFTAIPELTTPGKWVVYEVSLALPIGYIHSGTFYPGGYGMRVAGMLDLSLLCMEVLITELPIEVNGMITPQLQRFIEDSHDYITNYKNSINGATNSTTGH